MSDQVTQRGQPHGRGASQQGKYTGVQNTTYQGRPAPINTTIGRGRGRGVSFHEAAPTSSGSYSPSVRTDSSIVQNAAPYHYSPSIWSGGVGTPMTIPEPMQTAFPSRYQLRADEIAKPSTHVYLDENNMPFQTRLPLTRDHSGQYRDAEGRVCIPPKATVLPEAKSSSATVSDSTLASPQSMVLAKAYDANHDSTTLTSDSFEDEDSPGTPGIQITGPSSADLVSHLSPPYTVTHPHVATGAPDIFVQEPNGGSFQCQLATHSKMFAEVFVGAKGVVKATNPSHHQMNWNARVICAKTESVKNIAWSIQGGKWAATDKVGHRMNEMYDQAKGNNGDVWLLFSVNGQKCYCGLAKMQGRWSPTAEVEGWTADQDGARSMGIMPVCWSFIKNVPYEYFRDIKHPSSAKQPIYNMWNGMHFPYKEGREVIAVYVKTAHFTNPVCYRKDQPYNPFKQITDASVLDPRLKARQNNRALMKTTIAQRKLIEGTKQLSMEPKTLDTSSTHAAPKGATQGLASSTQKFKGGLDGDTTPTGPSYRSSMAGDVDHPPPNFDGTFSPTPQPGDMFVVDKQGNLVKVNTTHPPAGTLQGLDNSSNRMSPQQKIGGYNQQKHHAQRQATYLNIHTDAGRGVSPHLGEGSPGGVPQSPHRTGAGFVRGGNDLVCWDCGEPRHIARNCPYRGLTFKGGRGGRAAGLRGGPSNINTGGGRDTNLDIIRGTSWRLTNVPAPNDNASVLRYAAFNSPVFVPAASAYPPAPALHHTAAQGDFNTAQQGLGSGYFVYPTPLDGQNVQEKLKELESSLKDQGEGFDEMRRQIIDLQHHVYFEAHKRAEVARDGPRAETPPRSEGSDSSAWERHDEIVAAADAEEDARMAAAVYKLVDSDEEGDGVSLK